MKLIKKTVVKIIHSLGYDIIKLPKKSNFLGLERFPIRTIIDIGANCGQFAKKVLQAFPNADIYCFEPLIGPFQELQKWVNSQEASKITIFNLALGDSESMAQMFFCLERNDSSSFLKSTALGETLWPFMKKQELVSVKLTTLDKVMSNLPQLLLSDILIKIDVEGYEDRVIQGGQDTFRKAKACILEISLDKLYKNQASFKKIFLLMDQLGFEYVGNLEQVFAKDSHVIYIDAVFLKKL